MIDRDLANLYGVETKYLNRQVKRNRERFPPEFMIQLTNSERDELVTNWHRFASLKHSTVLPYAFTEHGVAMLSSILHGKRAIHINILIIKVFVKLREILATHKELAERLQELEVKIEKHDDATREIFEAIRQLMLPPDKPKRRIGFDVE
jgi:phage regulator Rha-like protein